MPTTKGTPEEEMAPWSVERLHKEFYAGWEKVVPARIHVIDVVLLFPMLIVCMASSAYPWAQALGFVTLILMALRLPKR